MIENLPEMLNRAIMCNEQNLTAITDAQVDVVVERRVSDNFRIESLSRWRRSGTHDRVDVVFTDMEMTEFTPETHTVWDSESLSQRCRYFDGSVLVLNNGKRPVGVDDVFESNFDFDYEASSGVDFASVIETAPHHVGLMLMLAPVPNYGLRQLFETAKSLNIVSDDSSGLTVTVVPPKEIVVKYKIHFRADMGFLVDRVKAWAGEFEDGDGVPKVVTDFVQLNGVFFPTRLVRSRDGIEIERVTVKAEINSRSVSSLDIVEFPEGSRVEDHVNEKFHVWGAMGPVVSFDTYNKMGEWCFSGK